MFRTISNYDDIGYAEHCKAFMRQQRKVRRERQFAKPENREKYNGYWRSRYATDPVLRAIKIEQAKANYRKRRDARVSA